MRIYKILFLLTAVSFTSGCMDETHAESPQPAESKFYKLISGDFTDNGTLTEKQTKVITTQASYNEELLNYSSSIPANIDFNVGQVLLVDMGQRPYPGYRAVITSIDVSDYSVTANIELGYPADCPDVSFPAVMTNPYQFVFIPTRKEILVKESLSIADCS